MSKIEIINCKYGKLNIFSDLQSGNLYQQLKRPNYYQPWIIKWAEQYSRTNSTILDVGANIGCFTLPFAKLHQGTCKIYAFEPLSDAYTLLLSNIKLNNLNNVVPINMGLSFINKNIKVFIPSDPAHFSIEDKYQNIWKENKSEIIKLCTLDSLNLQNISFIKVDIQDHEFKFLQGAKNTLKKDNITLILELPIRDSKELNHYKKCTLFLNGLGYKEISSFSKDRLFIK
jgi:FkbM family methyltransferase